MADFETVDASWRTSLLGRFTTPKIAPQHFAASSASDVLAYFNRELWVSLFDGVRGHSARGFAFVVEPHGWLPSA
jgi:hypothetical protein